MLKCGDTIKQQGIKMKVIFTNLIGIKQTTSGSLHMEQLCSKIPDVAFNYKEFQEPLFALD